MIFFCCHDRIRRNGVVLVCDKCPASSSSSSFRSNWLTNSQLVAYFMERGSSAEERRTRNQVSPGSNPPLVPFRRLGIFVLSIDAPVDSAV